MYPQHLWLFITLQHQFKIATVLPFSSEMFMGWILFKYERVGAAAGVLSCVQTARNETFIFLVKLKPALHHLQGNKQYRREANLKKNVFLLKNLKKKKFKYCWLGCECVSKDQKYVGLRLTRMAEHSLTVFFGNAGPFLMREEEENICWCDDWAEKCQEWHRY